MTEIIYANLQRTFRNRNDYFKSVRGRQYAEGKAKQAEKEETIKDMFLETTQRAVRIPPKSDLHTLFNYRIGTSETIGGRAEMDDVTLVKEFCDGVLIGVFDGHGGREASEYVSQHFAEVLQTHFE
jgi:hypothetical protein